MDQTVNASADPGANSSEAPRLISRTGGQGMPRAPLPSTPRQPPMPADAELSASMKAKAAATAAGLPPGAQNTPGEVTMNYAGVTLSVTAADVEAHKRAGWTINGPDAAPAA